MQLALTDSTGKPFADLMREKVLDPLGMSQQHVTSSRPAMPWRSARGAPTTARARAWEPSGTSIRSRPRPACGPRRATWPGSRSRSSCRHSARQGPVAGAAREMIAPTGVGPFAVGFPIDKRGEGWYFTHSGGNWGFHCDLLAHV